MSVMRNLIGFQTFFKAKIDLDIGHLELFWINLHLNHTDVFLKIIILFFVLHILHYSPSFLVKALCEQSCL